MTQATGRATDTGMMAHWRATKARHPNAILLYRVGDFYEWK